MPVIVFDFSRPHNLKRVILGEKVGTLVTGRRKNIDAKNSGL